MAEASDVLEQVLTTNEGLKSVNTTLESQNRDLVDQMESLRLWCQACESRVETTDGYILDNNQLETKVRQLEEELRSVKFAWELEKSEMQSRIEETGTKNTQLVDELASLQAACQTLVEESSTQTSPSRVRGHVTTGAVASDRDADTIREAICCTICTEILKEPVTGSCCHAILGCDSCVRRSMEVSGGKCPLCRGEGISLTHVRGLDELFLALGRVFPSEES